MVVISKYLKKINRASMTVEAAYIVPIILLITIAFLFVILIEHDRGIVYMELRKLSEELCNAEISDVDDVSVSEDKLQKRMFIYNIDYIDVECKTNKTIIQGHMSCKTGPKQLRECSISITQKKVNACKNVRRTLLSNG